MLRIGQFVETSAGALDFKFILHTNVPHHHEVPDSKATIRDILKRVFEFMDIQKLQRLALPPIGTGIAGIPVANFVNGFYEALTNHTMANPKTKVKLIDIVAYD